MEVWLTTSPTCLPFTRPAIVSICSAPRINAGFCPAVEAVAAQRNTKAQPARIAILLIFILAIDFSDYKHKDRQKSFIPIR
jgi:hypothetical protein